MKRNYLFKLVALVFPMFLVNSLDVWEKEIFTIYVVILYVGLLLFDINNNDMANDRSKLSGYLLLVYPVMLAFSIFLISIFQY